MKKQGKQDAAAAAAPVSDGKKTLSIQAAVWYNISRICAAQSAGARGDFIWQQK